MKYLEHILVAESPITCGTCKWLVTCVNLHMLLDIMLVWQQTAAFKALVTHLSSCLILNRLHHSAEKEKIVLELNNDRIEKTIYHMKHNYLYSSLSTVRGVTSKNWVSDLRYIGRRTWRGGIRKYFFKLEFKIYQLWIFKLRTIEDKVNSEEGCSIHETIKLYGTKTKLNSMVWVRERTIPTEWPPLSAKWLPTFVDRGCHVVSVTDPYGRILGFLDRSTLWNRLAKSAWEYLTATQLKLRGTTSRKE
jgi:hypothetical protein